MSGRGQETSVSAESASGSAAPAVRWATSLVYRIQMATF
jgi:hypothetical protein